MEAPDAEGDRLRARVAELETALAYARQEAELAHGAIGVANIYSATLERQLDDLRGRYARLLAAAGKRTVNDEPGTIRLLAGWIKKQWEGGS